MHGQAALRTLDGPTHCALLDAAELITAGDLQLSETDSRGMKERAYPNILSMD